MKSILLLLLFGISISASAEDVDEIEKILNSMTIEEKVGQAC